MLAFSKQTEDPAAQLAWIQNRGQSNCPDFPCVHFTFGLRRTSVDWQTGKFVRICRAVLSDQCQLCTQAQVPISNACFACYLSVENDQHCCSITKPLSLVCQTVTGPWPRLISCPNNILRCRSLVGTSATPNEHGLHSE